MKIKTPFQFLLLIIITLLFENHNCHAQEYKYSKSVESALIKAGKNKEEYIKVLKYYSKSPSDSLKLIAAINLISNIPYHSFKNDYEDYIDLVNYLDKQRIAKTKEGIEENKIRDYTKKTFERASISVFKSSIKNKHERIQDIDIINSEFLIKNIDLAFKAHNLLPKEFQSNFEDFLNYVLPYRNGNEPIEFGKRKELFEKYSWVYDSLKTMPIDKIIEKIYNDLNLEGGQRLLGRLNGLLSLSQIEKLRFGRCDDNVNYFVMLFRSLGFAAGQDYITHWGNFYHSSGHAWVFLKINNNLLPIQVSVDKYSNSTSKKIFQVGSIPKIYRKNFIKINHYNLKELPKQDVTNLYRLTSNISVQNIFKSSIKENFKLCVYDNRKEWAVVDENFEYHNNKVSFKNVGRGVLYSICVEENSALIPVNYPIYLDFKGNLKFLNNKQALNKEAFVTRKYPPFFPHINTKPERIKSLNHCIVQGANTLDNKDFVTLFRIQNFSSSQRLKFRFQKNEQFRYYRIYSDDDVKIHLAGFNLLDHKGEAFKYLEPAYNSLGTSDRLMRILDNDPLSYIEFKNLNIAFEVPSNQLVSGFEIQARNDDNHINIGEEYELFIYNKGWKSIKKEVASDTILTYSNLYKNGLYLLKNRTKGKEENVFTFDETGNQIWFGVSDIKDILKDYR